MSRSIQRTRRTTRRAFGASLVLLASLLQPAWALAPGQGGEGEDCCCPSAARPAPASIETAGCCATPEASDASAPAYPVEGDCGCRALPADERPAPAAPAAADVTRELIRRHHLAAELATRAPGVGGFVAENPRDDGLPRRAHDPPGVRTAPARSLGERGVARLLAFLSVARI